MIPSHNAGLASARRLLPPKPRTAFLILLVLAVLAWPGRSHAKKQLPPRGPNLARPAVCIAPTSASPQIDGLLTDACWSSAVVVRPFHLSYEGGWPPYRTEAVLTYDAANLYVGLRTLDPDWRVHPPFPWPPDRDPSVAELLVDAGMEEAFYKVAVTSAAEVHVTQPMASVVPWRQGVTAAMKPFAGGWVAEFAIPFAAVELPAPGPTCTWRVNLGWRTPKCVGYSSWAVTHAWFYEPQYYGDLHFGGPHALTAELTEVTAPQPGRNPLKIVLRNRGAAAAECEVLVTLADRTGARVVFQQFVPVPGDGGTDVAADYTLPDGLDGIATVTVRRRAARDAFFRQSIHIQIPPNKETYRAIQAALAALAPCPADAHWPGMEKEAIEAELQKLAGVLFAADVSRNDWDALEPPLVRLLGRARKLLWWSDHRPRLAGARFAVATQHVLQKIRRDEAHTGPPTDIVDLSAARGEYESVQLVVIPWERALQDLDVSVSPLTGPGGATIPASAVDVRWTGFVETRPPRYPVDFAGWVADPLIPLAASTRTISADALHQPLWLTIHVPRAVPAGMYTGTMAVCAAGAEPWPLQLRVRVYDFTLPTRPALQTSMWLNEQHIKDWYGWDEIPAPIRRKQMAFLLEHRVNPSWFGPIGDAEDIEFQMERGLNLVMLGVADRWPLAQDVEQRLAGHYDFFKRQGWLDRTFIYGQDEPSAPDYPKVRDTLQRVAERFPGARRVCTAYPPVNALEGAVDTWVVGPNLFNYEAVAARLAAGDEIWIYLSASVRRPYVAQFYLDYTALEHRLVTWCCWKYGATGFLYWGINEWQSNNQPWSGRPAIDDAIRAGKRWPEVPWNTWTYLNCNGDAQYIYPGTDGTFWSSVRFEILRDAFEDYDYLSLLEDSRKRLAAKNVPGTSSFLAETQELLTIGPPLISSLADATENPHVLLQRRNAIAEQLERRLSLLVTEKGP